MTYRPDRMRFGIFLAPFHRVGENPTVALDRDIELTEFLDRLNFDEAWFGEHHSAGWELIASPELMIAAAAQRTRTIRLGTGVSSLPYHHPFMLADRMVQLDHMTRGRAMFGVGPGALTSDAHMLGIDAITQRQRMDEALGVILRLFRGETVSIETDWFTMREARLQLAPYTHPHMPVAVASTFFSRRAGGRRQTRCRHPLSGGIATRRPHLPGEDLGDGPGRRRQGWTDHQPR
ncbi:MAG: LLM class flavin-dependent oxidoreductase [Dehalococcoidia bacterium]|nr:LLM class flavin-dependent oxidoreductase [Dehalococcoidia bacterium]